MPPSSWNFCFEAGKKANGLSEFADLRCSRIRRSISASVLDLVDSAWLDGDAGPARAHLAAHCISALGNCHRAWPVALPPHTGRAVVRSPSYTSPIPTIAGSTWCAAPLAQRRYLPDFFINGSGLQRELAFWVLVPALPAVFGSPGRLRLCIRNSPLGLDKWLSATWLVSNCKNGVSSCEVARALNVTQKTAWFMDHRIQLRAII
jgi:hypothetical protein